MKNNLINTVNGEINIFELSARRKEYEKILIPFLEDKDFEYIGKTSFENSWHWHGEGKTEEKDSFFYTRTTGDFNGMIEYGQIPSISSYFLFNESFVSKLERMTKFTSKLSYLEAQVYNLIKESIGEQFKISTYKNTVCAKYDFPIGKINFQLFLNSHSTDELFETKEKRIYQNWELNFCTKKPRIVIGSLDSTI